MHQPHATADFETFSPAGFEWVPEHTVVKDGKPKRVLGKWKAPFGAREKGLSVVGASVYTEHPEAEVLTFSYRLPGRPLRRWRPGLPNPQDLFDWLAAGGLMEAHNVMFERLVWENICVRKYGWPPLLPHQYQLRCSAAQARVASLPGGLEPLSEVLQLAKPKDADGKRLLKIFSIPRDPTLKDPRTRILPPHLAELWASLGDQNALLAKPEDAIEFGRLEAYCDRDIEAEEEASSRTPPMTDDEVQFWLIDQEINWRGVAIDRDGIENCKAVLEQALERYGDEYRAITGLNATQLEATKGWLAAKGIMVSSLDQDAVDDTLARAGNYPHHVPGHPFVMAPIAPHIRRLFEIRQLIGSASVKKLYAMSRQASRDERIRNLIIHHGARTGRPTGDSVQPLNLPKAGPELKWCGSCSRPFRATADACVWCSAAATGLKAKEWSAEAAGYVLEIMAHRSLELVEWYFGDAVLCISGCIRGLFVAGPGMDLIASDFSAIEAVVTAQLAQEEWRIQAFRDKVDIYLASAGKITGRSVEEYAEYKALNGTHHPDRQKIGKPAELGLGFGGWIGAWRVFDDSDTFADDAVKRLILDWREASPGIVELWGGQSRGSPFGGNRYQEFYGFEGCAVQAVSWPGQVFSHRGISFFMRGDALIVRLLSGRELTYHNPRLTPSTRPYAAPWEMSITYMTWNSNTKYGAMGWVAMSTFGGRLTENIVQAIAHDILRFSIVNLRAAGYPTVLHIYDEIVVEVPQGTGSIEEVERIMAIMPWWAAGWPVRASGGWRGFRYRKG